MAGMDHPAQQPAQHSPYSQDVRERVIQEWLDGTPTSVIAANGHPCSRTVQRWVDEFLVTGEVLAAKGRQGIKHASRKFSHAARRILVELVVDMEQSELADMAGMIEYLMPGTSWSEVGNLCLNSTYARATV